MSCDLTRRPALGQLGDEVEAAGTWPPLLAGHSRAGGEHFALPHIPDAMRWDTFEFGTSSASHARGPCSRDRASVRWAVAEVCTVAHNGRRWSWH